MLQSSQYVTQNSYNLESRANPRKKLKKTVCSPGCLALLRFFEKQRELGLRILIRFGCVIAHFPEINLP